MIDHDERQGLIARYRASLEARGRPAVEVDRNVRAAERCTLKELRYFVGKSEDATRHRRLRMGRRA